MPLKKQYETPDNFRARVHLTERFKTNPETWNKWLFRQMPPAGNLNILELGCGTGLFWRVNGKEIPASWNITLTDYSPGMLRSAEGSLKLTGRKFNFEIADAENLAYGDSSFDVVIANLMLYHIQDRNKALSGISRILKGGGSFMASTFGRSNMLELNLLLYDYLKGKGKARPARDNPFSLENGYDQLAPFFVEIRLSRYEDSLSITEADPVIDYFLSFNDMREGYALLDREDIDGFRERLESELKRNGVINVSKDTGVFICEK
jgi:ubiquinone/menaquinone biosynthesis C-methylase UbiE